MDWTSRAYKYITPFPGFWWLSGVSLLAPLGFDSFQEVISQLLQRGLRDMDLKIYYICILALIVIALCWKLIQVQLPKFKISLPNNGWPVITPEKIHNKDGQVIQEIKSAYIRICVESRSKIKIQDCSGHIVSMKKLVDGKWEECEVKDSMQLRWSLLPLETISVPYRVKRHLDIVRASDHDNKMVLAGMWPLTLRGFFEAKTTYQFDITVDGDGIAEDFVINVSWGGQWDSLKAEVANVSR